MRRRGFTIVELIVVIAVIAILAGASIVGYGAWRHNVLAAQVKSDLNGVITAMDNSRNFNNTYPSTIPSSFTASNGVVLTGGSVDGITYCVDGTSSSDSSIHFYASSETKAQGALSGDCATRPTILTPSIPGNVAVVSTAGTKVNLSWSAASNAASYKMQCASDAAFTSGVQVASVVIPATTGTVSGLAPGSTYYCRVNATNQNGTSSWSVAVSTDTTTDYGSLAVASSIEGYWTTAPKGFLLEDGSAVSRTTYADLFAVIGTTYGAGDGSTTFNVPDSRGRTAVMRNATDVEFATVGQKTGSKTETLTIAQMPSHTHVQNAHTHGISDPGHNHSQNPHSHNQNVGAGNGTGGIRRDYNSDGAGGIYSQNISTDNAWPTNNPSMTGVSFTATVATNQSTGGNGSHDNIQPSIVKMMAIKYTRADTGADTYPAGATIQGYWTTAPTGYALEDGSAVSRTTYADLFAVIGTTYGAGDGSTTFNLPDSRGRVGINISSADTEFDTMGEKTGSKAETLTIAQMPSHTHVQNAHTHGISDPGHNHSQNPHSHGEVVSANSGGTAVRNDWDSDGNTGGYPQGFDVDATVGTNNPSTTGVSVVATTATNQSTGGGGSHNNIQPSITKQSAIKLTPATTGDGSAPDAAVGTSLSGWWSSAPSGYLVENGAAVSRTTYASLFAVIGTTYGTGDGSTTFNLPDSRGRAGVNKSPTDTEFNVIGQKYGSKSATLTIAQMPSHTHIQNSHTHGVSDPGHNHSQNGHAHTEKVSNPLAGGGAIRNDYNSDANGGIYSSGITTNSATATNNPSTTGISVVAATATNQSTGGDGAHNEIQPSITKLFVIKY